MTTMSTQRWRLRGAVAVLAIVALVVLTRTLPVASWLDVFANWVERQGIWAPLIFGAVYATATVLFVPGSVLTLAAGAVFGIVRGTLVVWFAATLGAALSFLISRYAFREWITRRLATHPRFAAVDRAIGRDGARIVLLLRLSPVIPFNVLNYLLGATSVRFWPATLASWIGMLPGALLYIYLGSAGRAGLDLASARAGELDWLGLSFYGVGLVALIVGVVIIRRVVRRAIREAEAKPSSPDGAT
jgi:uncharacterized membrane protein YdjX (TVP38/TMEM64 family)